MSKDVSTRELNRITSKIIECAIRIHRALGPGLLENAYLGCLCFDVSNAGLRIVTQKALPLVYSGVNIVQRVINRYHPE
jgi:GxxExxY protein